MTNTLSSGRSYVPSRVPTRIARMFYVPALALFFTVYADDGSNEYK